MRTATGTQHETPALGAVAIAGAVTAALLLLPLLLGGVFYERDLLLVEVGHRCALDGLGWLPLDGVTPTIGNGAPAWAHPSSQLLYPIRWLTRLFSPHVGAHVDAALHLAGAAAAATWLLLTWRVRPPLAAAGGLAWALSGSVLDLISKSETTVGALWLPLGWAAARAAKQRDPRWWAVLAAAMALVLLGGDVLTGGLLVVVVVVELAVTRDGRKMRLQLVRPGMALAAGASVGMAQWLPTLAEAALGRRTQGLPAEEVLHWSFHPLLWPALVAPGVGTTEGGAPGLGQLIDGGAAQWWNEQPYVGWLPLMGAMLAAMAIVRGRAGARPRRAVSALVLAMLWFGLALGQLLPLSSWAVETLPLAGTLRYPMKLLPAAGLAVTVLFVVEAQRWRRPARARTAMKGVGLSVVGALLVFGLLIGVGQWWAAEGADIGPDRWMGGVLLGLLPTALAVVCWKKRRLDLAVVVVALEAVLMFPSHAAWGPTLDDAHGPLVDLPDDAVLCSSPLLSRLGFGSEGWERMLVRRAWGAPESMACDDVSTPAPYTTPMTARTSLELIGHLGDRGAALAASRALGCTHYLGPAPPASVVDDEPLRVPPGLDGEGRPRAWRLPDAYAPVFVVSAPRVVAEEAVVDEVLAGERGVIDRFPNGAVASPARDVRVQLEGRGTSFMELSFSGNGAAVVGVRQTYAAGWSARQADRELSVVRIDGHLLGVLVDDVTRGPVALRYEASARGAALAGGALGLLMIAGLALVRRRSGWS